MQAVSSFFGTAFALGVVLVVAKSFPSAATAVIAGDVHRAWAHLLETYTHKQLYIGGIFACFVVPFYTVCLVRCWHHTATWTVFQISFLPSFWNRAKVAAFLSLHSRRHARCLLRIEG